VEISGRMSMEISRKKYINLMCPIYLLGLFL